jgi:hypothetical protein
MVMEYATVGIGVDTLCGSKIRLHFVTEREYDELLRR